MIRKLPNAKGTSKKTEQLMRKQLKLICKILRDR
jgi:hypothetical protein